ncbi:hypothetical protein BCR43DRAFT_481165 [Syncephalastrum racemosum]|uniref:Uncharacterized protein n=1 Tax=Syncephalastrum racemosum TaxID=13706 RepID=A0A1X2HRL1_SYNRA|nr:hypothetical protein BCR43DRAFT_481165 [Syncephalastrum racemosum]
MFFFELLCNCLRSFSWINRLAVSTAQTTAAAPEHALLRSLAPPSTHPTGPFLTESTLIVDQAVTGAVGMTTYDDWTLQTWLSGLPKLSLCHILTNNLLQNPKVASFVESTRPTPAAYEPYWPPLMRSFPTTAPLDEKKTAEDSVAEQHYQELVAIQSRARQIVHQIDAQRPSDQYASEEIIARDLRRLIRLCTNTLYATADGHSMAALVGLLVVAQECLEAIPRLRRYLFSQAGTGRLIVLEMASILKNFKQPSAASSLIAQRALLLKILEPPPGHSASWFPCVIENTCLEMADHDREWVHKQEYENVAGIASQYL